VWNSLFVLIQSSPASSGDLTRCDNFFSFAIFSLILSYFCSELEENRAEVERQLGGAQAINVLRER